MARKKPSENAPVPAWGISFGFVKDLAVELDRETESWEKMQPPRSLGTGLGALGPRSHPPRILRAHADRKATVGSSPARGSRRAQPLVEPLEHRGAKLSATVRVGDAVSLVRHKLESRRNAPEHEVGMELP